MVSMPSIIIDQSYGSLAIEITHAQMKITNNRPEMKITREDPSLTVESEMPEFKVNWQKVRNESGLPSPSEIARRNRAKSIESIGTGTSRTVNEGNTLGDVVHKGNRVANIERQKTIRSSHLEVNFGTMPQSMPEVEWSKGYVNIDWSKGDLIVDFIGDYMPEVALDPPFSIDIYLKEKPYIRIMVNDGEAPGATGNLVNQVL